MVNAAALLAVILVLFPVVSHLPRAVLSAAIMVIAVQHIDPGRSTSFAASARPHRASAT